MQAIGRERGAETPDKVSATAVLVAEVLNSHQKKANLEEKVRPAQEDDDAGDRPLPTQRSDEALAQMRRRNALYSKRKYYKRKQEVERLEVKRYQLQSDNHRLRQENEQFEQLLQVAQQRISEQKQPARRIQTAVDIPLGGVHLDAVRPMYARDVLLAERAHLQRLAALDPVTLHMPNAAAIGGDAASLQSLRLLPSVEETSYLSLLQQQQQLLMDHRVDTSRWSNPPEQPWIVPTASMRTEHQQLLLDQLLRRPGIPPPAVGLSANDLLWLRTKQLESSLPPIAPSNDATQAQLLQYLLSKPPTMNNKHRRGL